jgi:uncharacterized protein YcbX
MITRLVRNPVKSMLGEALRHASLTPLGVAGDRASALIEAESGRIVTAKHPRKWSRMLTLAAAYADTGAVTITFPGGQTKSSNDSEIDSTLSAYLGHAVCLSFTPPDNGAIERVDPVVNGEVMDEGRRRVTESRLPGLEQGSFVDYAAVHLVTTATLNRLEQLAPGRRFDVARFRPNLLLDLSDTVPFEENTWTGRRMYIGADVVLELDLPAPRCAIPALAQPDLPYDPEVIRAIAQHNRITIPDVGPVACVGVYARVLQAGTIRVGDPVALERAR